jgi:putative copper export protein
MAHHGNFMAALNILMRFVHIISAVVLLGSLLAWLLAVTPALAALAEDTRRKVDNAIAASLRPLALSAMAGLLISGLYNFLNKTGLTPAYHAVIGVKFLLVLHVFAVTYIATKPDNPKRVRQLTGVAVSGVVIVLLSAVLRWLHTQ